MAGKQVKLFLVDGTPGGLTTAEITNWTGHVLTARRSDLGELLRRDEARRTSVYLLLGSDEGALGGTRCYVGEADVIADRLRVHHRDKDFWDKVVVVTSKDANLTKSHVRYLESRLIALATQAGRVSLENGTNPPPTALPEADRSDMEYFLDQLQVILPVLGVNAIRVREVKPEPAVPETLASPVFRLVNKRHGIGARAQQIDGEFTVLTGSTVAAHMPEQSSRHSASTAAQYRLRRDHHAKLIADGSIAVVDGVATVMRDIVFSSPSAAGAVVQGQASANGRIAWVAEDGQSFGAWESRGVE